MFKELGIVVLNHDFKKYGLKEGSIGTVVHVYKDKKHAGVGGKSGRRTCESSP